MAIWEGTIAAADVYSFNDFFVSSTNDPSSDARWWINEWDAEQQYLNWDDKLAPFMQRIEDLKQTNSVIRGLIGSVMPDWCDDTCNVCLSALRNLHINQWIYRAELMPPHPHRPRPTELNCFEHENFAHTARQWSPCQTMPVEPSLFVTIPQMPTQQVIAARSEHPPEAYFIQGGKHQKKVNWVMRTWGKGEPKHDYHKRKEVKEGRK